MPTASRRLRPIVELVLWLTLEFLHQKLCCDDPVSFDMTPAAAARVLPAAWRCVVHQPVNVKFLKSFLLPELNAVPRHSMPCISCGVLTIAPSLLVAQIGPQPLQGRSFSPVGANQPRQIPPCLTFDITP